MSQLWARFSLLKRVLIITASLLVTGYVAGAYLFVTSQIGMYRATVVAETNTWAELMTVEVGERAVTGDYAGIEQLLRVWSRNGHYLELDYTDAAGNTISITQAQARPRYPSWFKAWVGLPTTPNVRPVNVGGHDYGTVQVWGSHVGFLNGLWTAALRQLALAGGVGLVLLATFAMIIRHGLRPLGVLRQIAAAVDGGAHVEVPILRSAAPEVIDTIITFNKAAAREAWLAQFLEITAGETPPLTKVEAVLGMICQRLQLAGCAVSWRGLNDEFRTGLSFPHRPPWGAELWAHWLVEVVRERRVVQRVSTSSLVDSVQPLRVYVGLPLHIGTERIGVLSLFGVDTQAMERINARMTLLDMSVNWIGVTLAEDMHEKLLLEQKERAEAVLGSVYEGIMMLDEVGDVLTHNPAAAAIFGLRDNEGVGRWLGELIPEGLFSPGQHLVADVVAMVGESGTRQCMGLRRDGRQFPLEISLREVRDSAPPMYVAVVRDVTERIEVEQALRHGEARLRRAQQVARIGEWHYAQATGEINWSPESADVFGLPPGTDASHPRVLSMIHPEDRDELMQAIAHAASTGLAVRQEFRVRGTDGSTRHLDLLGETNREPGRYGNLFGVIQDITERKLAEAKAHSALIEQLRAEARNRAKSQFLANMSHELRTPLNAILGYSEMLEEDARDQGLDHMVADLEKIRTAGRHLLSLISDILDLSKIEAGRMTLLVEEFSLPDLMAEVAATMEPLMRKNENKLTVSCADSIGNLHADVTRLRQMLFNLMSNAAKFTQHGRVDVQVEKYWRDAQEWLSVRVSDSGIGMTSEQMGRLFEPFTQADASTTRKYGGTGLGLAISRHFCQLMGGDITVESEEGKGSTFTIDMPATVAAPLANTLAPGNTEIEPVRSPSSERRQHMSTVLAIDDDPAIRQLLEHVLGSHGMRVVTAANGTEGLRLARVEKPSVVLLDILMPASDGWAVLRALKADAELRNIPTIMLTTESAEDAALALGAADYLRKPIDQAKLGDVVKRWLRRGSTNSVLVVDDNPLMRGMVASLMRAERWNVREAQDGLAALAQVRAAMPTLIVLDLNMPNMNGEAFLEQLGEIPGGDRPVVIVLTGADVPEDVRCKLAERVSRFVMKGEDLTSELRVAIDHALAVGLEIPAAA